MPLFRIPKSFKKVYDKKEASMREAIDECVLRLSQNPRHPGLQTHKMRGHDGVWEAYIDQGNRVTFHYDEDGTIVFRNNCNHDMLKKNP